MQLFLFNDWDMGKSEIYYFPKYGGAPFSVIEIPVCKCIPFTVKGQQYRHQGAYVVNFTITGRAGTIS